MEGVDSNLTYRCIGCGHKYSEPNYCPCCGSHQCPECKRTETISCEIKRDSIVSDKAPLRASELKTDKPRKSSKVKRKGPKKKSLAELSEKLGIKLDL